MGDGPLLNVSVGAGADPYDVHWNRISMGNLQFLLKGPGASHPSCCVSLLQQEFKPVLEEPSTDESAW